MADITLEASPVLGGADIDIAGNRIAESELRRRLPELTSKDALINFDLIAKTAGLRSVVTKISPNNVNPSHCPFVCCDDDRNWFVVASTAHAGLVECLSAEGARVPALLKELMGQKKIQIWSMSVLDGPERVRASDTIRRRASIEEQTP